MEVKEVKEFRKLEKNAQAETIAFNY